MVILFALLPQQQWGDRQRRKRSHPHKKHFPFSLSLSPFHSFISVSSPSQFLEETDRENWTLCCFQLKNHTSNCFWQRDYHRILGNRRSPVLNPKWKITPLNRSTTFLRCSFPSVIFPSNFGCFGFLISYWILTWVCSASQCLCGVVFVFFRIKVYFDA